MWSFSHQANCIFFFLRLVTDDSTVNRQINLSQWKLGKFLIREKVWITLSDRRCTNLAGSIFRIWRSLLLPCRCAFNLHSEGKHLISCPQCFGFVAFVVHWFPGSEIAELRTLCEERIPTYRQPAATHTHLFCLEIHSPALVNIFSDRG